MNNTTKSKNQWLGYTNISSQKKPIKCFCLPFAGGGASTYYSWTKKKSSIVDFYPIQLPGRESRIIEPTFHRIDELILYLIDAIEEELDQPYVLFGHSMGALISFEWVREVRRRKLAEPLHLFVSGKKAPHMCRKRYSFPMSDEKMIEVLRDMKGTPEDVLQNQELLELILPMLKADFELVESYVYRQEDALSCPITAISSWDDDHVYEHELQDWNVHTHASFQTKMFPGDHFYLQNIGDELVDWVIQQVHDIHHNKIEIFSK